MGLCVGELSAIAVSIAKSLTELIPLAVQSVRVAVRTGVAALTIRNDLEEQNNPRDSWAMSVSREAGLTEVETLDLMHQQTVSTQPGHDIRMDETHEQPGNTQA